MRHPGHHAQRAGLLDRHRLLTRFYTSLDSQTLTIGGGAGKIRISSTGIEISYGQAVLKATSSQASIEYGNNAFVCSSGGASVIVNGSSQTFNP